MKSAMLRMLRIKSPFLPQTAYLFEVAADHDEARQLADNLLNGDGAQGVAATDVLQVFGGGRVIEENKPLSCRHCDETKGVPSWRKGGRIIRRTRVDGCHVWACHFCGREACVSPKGQK